MAKTRTSRSLDTIQMHNLINLACFRLHTHTHPLALSLALETLILDIFIEDSST